MNDKVVPITDIIHEDALDIERIMELPFKERHRALMMFISKMDRDIEEATKRAQEALRRFKTSSAGERTARDLEQARKDLGES